MTVAQPDLDAGLSLSSALRQSVSAPLALMHDDASAVQVNVTVAQPDVDAGLSLSNALRQSVSSGRLGTAISSAVGYDVSVSSEAENRMYILAQSALSQAQVAAGLTSE